MNDRAEQVRVVEALLFSAGEPVSEEALGLRFGDDVDVPALLAELAAFYEGRGVNLVRRGGGWIFATAPDLAPALRGERTVSRGLSRAAVETLAVIAYHQPVTRAEIEAIRGVALGRGALDRLLEAGWVRPRGRREAPGRPLNWVTTPHFLNHFGLDTLAELPGVQELRDAGLLEIGPAVLADRDPRIAEPPADE
jgi:segregation and condensation protein B